MVSWVAGAMMGQTGRCLFKGDADANRAVIGAEVRGQLIRVMHPADTEATQT